MSLTVADTPVILADPDLAEWIYNSIDPQTVQFWNHRAFLGPALSPLTIQTAYRPPRKIRVGRLVWPATASRWAYAFYLIDAKSLGNIIVKAYGQDLSQFNSVQVKIDSQVKGNKDSANDTYEVLTPQMYLLKPIPLTAFNSDDISPYPNLDINNLYLMCLVDQRYFWWYVNTGNLIIEKKGKDWGELFEYCAARINKNITYSDISSKYLKASSLLSANYEVIPPYIDAIAYNVGQRICVNVNSGRVFSQTFDSAYTVRKYAENRTPARSVRAGNYHFQKPWAY